MKTAFGVVGAIVVVAAICVGGWFIGWQVTKANTDQQYQVNTNSQQYQQSLVDQERNRVQGWDAATDASQKQQIAATFCATYQDLTHAPTDLVQASARMCN